MTFRNNSSGVPTHEFSAGLRKVAIRPFAASAMLSILFGCIFYCGHAGVGLLISLSACELFRELVEVAHSEVNKEREIPWFRTILWSWFVVAMFAAYTSDSLKAPLEFAGFVSNVPVFGSVLNKVVKNRQYHGVLGLGMYASSFVATVANFKPARLVSQMRALCFTMFALSIFVIPMKMMIYNTYMGLFWFLLPLLLVAANDSFAYATGFCFGRKFTKTPFLSISPNKTWEGFIGGGIATLVAGFYLPVLLNTQYLTCPYQSITYASVAECTPPPLFSKHIGDFREVQFHGLALACFASIVAPFGGFCASSIKRAYNLKDFSNLIPGHGGLMDRLDCQFLMAAATFVHLNTFVLTSNSEGALVQALKLVEVMDSSERAILVTALNANADLLTC